MTPVTATGELQPDKAFDEKRWATARARAALKGYLLLRTDPADGAQRVLVERYGVIRQLHDVGDLEGLLS